MNALERFKTVLNGGVPDRVPFFEVSASKSHIGNVFGSKVQAEMPASLEDLSPDCYGTFLQKTGIDLFYHSFLWKVGRVYRPDSNGRMHYVDGKIKDYTGFKFIDQPDATRSIARVRELSTVARRMGYPLVIGISGPYKLAKAAIGYEDFLVKSLDEPDFIRDLMAILGERELAILRQLIEYDVAAVLIPADTCMNIGPMMNRDSLRSLWLEPTKQYISILHERSIPMILHIDGDFSSIIDMVLELEPAAIHPFEVCGHLDIYKAKREYGDKVTLIGNIDLSGVLSQGTPNEVESSVEEHMRRLAPDGRYMCGSSHEISEAVPAANFQALCRSIRRCGGYDT